MAAGVPEYRQKHLKVLMEMAKNYVEIRSLLVQGLSDSDFNVALNELGKAKLAEIAPYLSTAQREVVERPDELTRLGQQIQAYNSVDETGKELGKSLYDYFPTNSGLCNYLIELPHAFSAGYVLSLALSSKKRNALVSLLLERLKQIVKPGKNAKETQPSIESLQAIVQLLFVLGDPERMSSDIGQLFNAASGRVRDDLTLAIRGMIEQIAKIVRSSDGTVDAIRDRNLGWTKAYLQWIQGVIPMVNDSQLIQIVESNYMVEPFILASPQQWDTVLLPHLLKSTDTCAQLSGLAALPPCHYRLNHVVDGLLELKPIPLQSLRRLTHKSYSLYQDFAESLWSVVCQKYQSVRGMREFWNIECQEGQGDCWQIENLVLDFPVEILALVVREMLASKGKVTGDQAFFIMTAYEVLKDSISLEDQNAYLQYVGRAPNGKELLLSFSLEHEPEEVAIEKFITALTEPKTRGDAIRALLYLKYRVADLEEFVEKLGKCPGSAQAVSLLKRDDSSQVDLSKLLELELNLERLGGAPPASHMEWLERVRKARQLYEELQIAKG